jgi:hypothetical protein
MPTNVLSMTQLKTMTLGDQIKALLSNGKVTFMPGWHISFCFHTSFHDGLIASGPTRQLLSPPPPLYYVYSL